MNPLAFKFIVGGALLVVLLVGGVYVKSVIAENAELQIKVAQAADYKKKVDKRDQEAAARLAADQRADAATGQELAELRAEAARLRAAGAAVPNTTMVPNRENPTCPEPRLSVGFWLCTRAAFTGDAGDAKACAAAGVHAIEPATPDTLQPAG